MKYPVNYETVDKCGINDLRLFYSHDIFLKKHHYKSFFSSFSVGLSYNVSQISLIFILYKGN